MSASIVSIKKIYADLHNCQSQWQIKEESEVRILILKIKRLNNY